MRRTLFRTGWVVLALLPIAATIEIIIQQDLPDMTIWKWGLLFGAVILVYFTRDRDDVLKHRVA